MEDDEIDLLSLSETDLEDIFMLLSLSETGWTLFKMIKEGKIKLPADPV